MKTILITGGSGFIGSNVVAALAKQGSHRLVICDNFGDGEKWRNIRNHHVHEIITPANLFYWLEMFANLLLAVYLS